MRGHSAFARYGHDSVLCLQCIAVLPTIREKRIQKPPESYKLKLSFPPLLSDHEWVQLREDLYNKNYKDAI